MKRIVNICMILTAAIFIFTGCGIAASAPTREERVESALQGTWFADASNIMWNDIYVELSFASGTYTKTVSMGALSETLSGEYTISENTVDLTGENGNYNYSLDYTFNEESGDIVLWWSSGKQLVKLF